jgi:DNA-binding transcriptional ArsR family regulator
LEIDIRTAADQLDSDLYIHKSGYMESESAILALAALAQPTRLDVFRLLVKHEPEGLAAGDIAKALAVPQNTMSSHLAILSRAGLVSAQRFSRSIVYRADLTRFQQVVLFMLRDCCDGRPEICAPLAESLAPCCPAPRKTPTKTPGKKTAHAKV